MRMTGGWGFTLSPYAGVIDTAEELGDLRRLFYTCTAPNTPTHRRSRPKA